MDLGEGSYRKPGRPSLLTAKDLEALKELVAAQPDLSLRAIGGLMEQRCGKRLAPATWSRALKTLGFRKHRRLTARPVTGTSGAACGQKVRQREAAPGRYPSCLTDYEWEALRPLVESNEGRGRPVWHDRRTMWDAVFYLVRSGASWRRLPADLPPYKAVFAFFARARDSGLLERVYERLHALWWERSGRDPLLGAWGGDTPQFQADPGKEGAPSPARR